MENGSPIERKNWFPNIEPLFKLLSYENVPPYLKVYLTDFVVLTHILSLIMLSNIKRFLLGSLPDSLCIFVLKGALRNAIAAFVLVSPVMKDTIWRYLEQYDLPVVVGPNAGNSGHSMDTQVSYLASA